jgi:hypothetical protein
VEIPRVGGPRSHGGGHVEATETIPSLARCTVESLPRACVPHARWPPILLTFQSANLSHSSCQVTPVKGGAGHPQPPSVIRGLSVAGGEISVRRRDRSSADQYALSGMRVCSLLALRGERRRGSEPAAVKSSEVVYDGWSFVVCCSGCDGLDRGQVVWHLSMRVSTACDLARTSSPR